MPSGSVQPVPSHLMFSHYSTVLNSGLLGMDHFPDTPPETLRAYTQIATRQGGGIHTGALLRDNEGEYLGGPNADGNRTVGLRVVCFRLSTKFVLGGGGHTRPPSFYFFLAARDNSWPIASAKTNP